MNLRTNCPKCRLDKLSHSVQAGKVLSVRCRACGWAKDFKPKATRYIKDRDYNE